MRKLSVLGIGCEEVANVHCDHGLAAQECAWLEFLN